MPDVVPSAQQMQRRPKGDMWSVDDDWRKAVLARMKERGLNKKQLAATLKVSPAAITQLLKLSTEYEPGVKPLHQSRLKPRIHEKLGLIAVAQTPAVPVEHEANRDRLLRVWPDLTETQREVLLRMAHEFTKARRS